MASIRQNLETIADFKEAVRSAVAALGLSDTPPSSLPALKAILDGGSAPLAARAALGAYFTDGTAPARIDLYRPGIPESMVELIGAVLMEGHFSGIPLDFRWPALATVDGSYPLENGTLSFPAATSLSASARFPVLWTSIELPLVEAIPAGPFSASYASCVTISAPSVLSVGAGAFAGMEMFDLNLPLAAEIGERAFKGCGMGSVTLPALAAVPSQAFANCYDLSVSLPSAATVAADAFSDSWYCAVSLPLFTVAQVEAANWFGAGEEGTEFICSDGRTQRPWPEE